MHTYSHEAVVAVVVVASVPCGLWVTRVGLHRQTPLRVLPSLQCKMEALHREATCRQAVWLPRVAKGRSSRLTAIKLVCMYGCMYVRAYTCMYVCTYCVNLGRVTEGQLYLCPLPEQWWLSPFVPAGLWDARVAIQVQPDRTTSAGRGDHAAGCACSGNCGSGICQFRVNQRRYQEISLVCLGVPLPGRALCPRCECEKDSCRRPRNGKLQLCARRWCHGCAPKSAMPRGQYSNASGSHTFGKAWSPVLKIVAAWSFLLTFLTPADCTTFVCFAHKLGVEPGAPLTAPRCTMLFLAHALKWPPVIQFLSSTVASDTVDSMSGSDIVRVLRAAMRFANGKTWPTMFHVLLAGLGHATTGMAIALQGLRLIETVNAASADSKRRKTTKGSQMSADAAEGIVSLGPRRRQYQVVNDDRVAVHLVEHMLTSAPAPCCWPRTAEEARSFARDLLNFARAVRSYSVEGWGLAGGRDDSHQYMVKNFCRAMLLVVESYLGPAAWDRFPFDQIAQEWTPDECGHAKPLQGMQCVEVRQLFGVSPLLTTCFMCLADDVPADQQAEALKLPHSKLWKVVVAYERAWAKEALQKDEVPDPVVAPGPRVLWQRANEQ